MTEQLDFIPADLTTTAAIAKWLEGVGYDPAMARFAASIATGESKGDVVEVDDEPEGGKTVSAWTIKYGTGQTNNASGSNQAGDHPNARRRKHRHPNGVEHAHVGGARPHTHDGKAGVGETKGDVPGHEFHGNQYTQGVPIGELDAERIRQAALASNADSPPHLLEAIRNGDPEIRVHARSVGGAGRGLAVNVIPGVNTIHGFAPSEEGRLTTMHHGDGRLSTAENAARSQVGRSVRAEAQVPVRFIDPDTGSEYIPGKTAEDETKGDVAGHEFHGNQWTVGGGAGAQAAQRYLAGMTPEARAKYTPRFTPRNDAQDAAIAQLLAKPSEGSQVVDGEQVPDAIRPSLPYEDRQDELAAAVKDHAGETRDVSVADLIATKPLLDRRAIPSTIKNLDGDPDFQRPGYLPVVAQKDGKTYVVDGHHRAEGAFLLGRPTLKVQFHDLDAKGAGTKGDFTGHPFRGNQYTGGGGSTETPQKVATVDEALDVLGHGKGVMFERPEQVVTLLDKLAQVARDARAKGVKAPVYDLCKVSAAGTNVFCHENVNIPRSEMPQLKGKPAPGTPAYALPRTPDGGVDLGPAFRDHLSAMGHTVEQTDESAARLRASQRELDGVKVAGMMDAIAAGKLAPEPIFTSNDNYVIDGHHRWAAMVGLGLKTGQDLRLPIQRVDMPVFQTLKAATDFTSAMGVQTAALGKALAPAEMKIALEVIRGYQEKGDLPGHEFHGNQYTHVFAPSDVKVGDLTIRNSDWDPAEHAVDTEFRTSHATVDVLNEGRGTGDKVFVGGSRNYPDLGEVYRAVAALPADTLILTSATNGASAAIRQAALDRGMELQVWSPIFDQRSHEAAYFARDQEMVQASDRVMSFWDQVSHGTNFEVDYARQIGKPVTQTVRAKDVELEVKGDLPGHEFHGNQYTGAQFTAANLTEKQRKLALASLAEFGTSPEKVEQNIQAMFDRATPEQLAAGKVWYAQAHAMAVEWAQKYGVTPQVAAAAIAATSPNCPWETNLKLAENALKDANSTSRPPFDAAWVAKLEAGKVDTDHYAEKNLACKDYPTEVLARAPFSKGLSSGIGKAIDMARGEPVEKILQGPKVNSFIDNIINPRGSQEVTVDVHANRIALGNPTSEAESRRQENLLSRTGVYQTLADSYRNVAAANGVSPLEMQAVTWVVQRESFRPSWKKEAAWEVKAAGDDYPDFGPQVLDDVSPEEVDQQIALNQLDSLATPEVRAYWESLLGDTFMGDEDPYDEGDDEDDEKSVAGETKGDVAGHEFHGNQYTGGTGRRANGGKAGLRKAVDGLLARAAASEPKITGDLSALAARLGGDINFLRPDGARALDMRLKSRESLNRKIRDGAQAVGISYAEKAADIKDAVRYTMLAPPGQYTNAYQGTIDSLRQQGYTIAESDIKNYWPEGNTYRGLNVAAIAPDGQRFELQFHTPDSLRTKEETLHPLYEEARKPETPQSRRDVLTEQMRQISALIPTPPGILATDHVRIE